MFRNNGKKRILLQKIIFTFLVLVLYLIGRSIPLYGVDVEAFSTGTVNVEILIRQTIGGDLYQKSLFALGIGPYMTSSILVQIIMAMKKTEQRQKISRIQTNRITLKLMLFLAIFQALLGVQKLEYAETNASVFGAQVVCVLEMIAGAYMILRLSAKNKKYGVGGQTVLILVNIVDGMKNTLSGHTLRQILIPVCISLVAMVVTLVMEFSEKRIGVQRISIHNIYADRNYIAIKANPIGIMPVMFSTAFFLFPQLIIYTVLRFAPQNTYFLWLKENLVLTRPLGITVYLFILYLLTIFFSRVMIHPGELTEQFLKSGDSLENLHPGTDTKRYLSKVVTRFSILGATVMAVCMAVPMVLSYRGAVESTLMMLPASAMMLTGMLCNLFQEMRAIWYSDSYERFI